MNVNTATLTMTMPSPPLEIPERYVSEQWRAADVEHVDLDAGTILMRAAPYGVECQLESGLFESFEPATFARAAGAPSRCKLWHLHGGPLIGHATEVEDRPDGVWVRARFSNTLNAQEARELAGDGTLDQASVEFRPMREFMRVERRADGLHVRHTRAGLLGVALVPHGAYDGGGVVVSVRDEGSDREREALIAGLRALAH